jgi:predicted small metal-binding protein
MSKSFTCRELGGNCDERFSGETFNEIMHSAMQHMMGDEAHKESIMSMEERTGETKEQWMARMQGEFDAKSEDA